MTRDEILHSSPSVFATCITPNIVKKDVILSILPESHIATRMESLRSSQLSNDSNSNMPKATAQIIFQFWDPKDSGEQQLSSLLEVNHRLFWRTEQLEFNLCLEPERFDLVQILQIATVYLPNPSWDVHYDIFRYAGFTNVRTYHYCDVERKALDIENMLQDLQEASEKSVFLLHASAHAPSGINPSMEQWKVIAKVVNQRKLFPFFYLDQQGLASGDLEKDSWPIRYFVDQGLELFVAQSFSKIFGLYSETVGNLIVVVKKPMVTESVNSQFTLLNVSRFSNPPAFGASLVHQVLTSPCLRKEWLEQLETMNKRMRENRLAFVLTLTQMGTPGTWSYIGRQSGLFCSLGLTRDQMNYLARNHNFHLNKYRCFNISCLNKHNMEYFVKALDSTVRNTM
ncbi:Protein CBR-GOT-1.3 [Caenorhabditis briggsae]|uniref:aspartate transaminase n=1 Tax=Caenorhabditis briggsae TaxID=6238 RepID=A8XNT7_CAEBR|nr:Protein CBR-GOT-1.3 [Caenorhabditis briggsae]CAP34176.1 Protein CBR-GOT-1.3 [Caenorhabditis briggsae]